jgi:hypothetical protein
MTDRTGRGDSRRLRCGAVTVETEQSPDGPRENYTSTVMQLNRPRSSRLAKLASIEACDVRLVDLVAWARQSGKTTYDSLDDEHVPIYLRPRDGGS